MGDPYLPPGCTDADIERAYGYDDRYEDDDEPEDPREDFEDEPCGA